MTAVRIGMGLTFAILLLLLGGTIGLGIQLYIDVNNTPNSFEVRDGDRITVYDDEPNDVVIYTGNDNLTIKGETEYFFSAKEQVLFYILPGDYTITGKSARLYTSGFIGHSDSMLRIIDLKRNVMITCLIVGAILGFLLGYVLPDDEPKQKFIGE